MTSTPFRFIKLVMFPFPLLDHFYLVVNQDGMRRERGERKQSKNTKITQKVKRKG